MFGYTWLANFIMRIFAMARGRAVAAAASNSTRTALVRSATTGSIGQAARNVVTVTMPNVVARNWPAAVSEVLRRAFNVGTFGYLVYEALNIFGLFEGQDETAARGRVDSILTAAGLDPNLPLGQLDSAQMDTALAALQRSLGSNSASANAILNGMRSQNPNLTMRDFLAEQDAVTEFTALCTAQKRIASMLNLSTPQVQELCAHLEVVFNAEADDSIRAAEFNRRMNGV